MTEEVRRAVACLTGCHLTALACDSRVIVTMNAAAKKSLARVPRRVWLVLCDSSILGARKTRREADASARLSNSLFDDWCHVAGPYVLHTAGAR